LQAYDAAAVLAPQNTYTHLQRLDLHRRLGHPQAAQAAMDEIATVAWDNNQTYAWAWEHLPASSGAVLDVGAPVPGMLRGVYAPEYDAERAFRWTLEQAHIRFAAHGADTLTLLLRGSRPDTQVRVMYQGEQVAVLRVGTTWQEFTVNLPENAPAASGYTVVELHTDTHVASTDEPYPRGVALGGAWLGGLQERE
jgi:hypothetical protein